MNGTAQGPAGANKSAQIRNMYDSGVSKAEIARSMGVRYQYVRNVIVHYETTKQQTPARIAVASNKNLVSRSVLLPKSLEDFLAAEASSRQISVSEVVAHIIHDYQGRLKDDRLSDAFEQIAGLSQNVVAQEIQRLAYKEFNG